MGITKDQIWAAADELQRLGKSPTLVAVREAIGETGSFSTIAPVMAEWRALQAKTTTAKTPAYSDDAGRRFQSKPATDSDASRPPVRGRGTGLGDYGFGAVRSVKSGVPRLRSDSPWSVIR